MDKIVIGLAGKKGAGKEKFVQYLQIAATETTQKKKFFGVRQVKSSGILVEILNFLDAPINRENLQNMAEAIRFCLGNNAISNAVRSKIRKNQTDITVFDGVRWQSDVDMVRTFRRSYIIFIETDEQIRYQRIRNRGEKPEEKNLSLEQFQKEEIAPTENYLSRIKQQADFVVENNGSEEELYQKVLHFFNNQISGE